MDDITDIEYNMLLLALAKCNMLQGLTKSGEFKLCIVSQDHIAPAAQQGHILMVLPFGFPEMTEQEYNDLMQKLSDGSDIAWLRKNREG